MKKIFATMTFAATLAISAGFFASAAHANNGIVEPPEIHPPAGLYHQTIRVSFTSAENAVHRIKYTSASGSTIPAVPGCRVNDPGTQYVAPFGVLDDVTFSAITCTSPTTGSAIETFAYTFTRTANHPGGGVTSNPTDKPNGPTCESDPAYCPPAAPVSGTSGYAADRPVFGNVLANEITSPFMRDLSLGSSGADVATLQRILANGGYLVMPQGTLFGTFGTLTQNAVIAFQKKNGITPAAGYFGTKTRARIDALSGVLPSAPFGSNGQTSMLQAPANGVAASLLSAPAGAITS